MSHSSDWLRGLFEGGMRLLIELRATGQLQLSKFTLKSLLLYTWRTNKSHQANQINRAGNTLFIITLIRTDDDWRKILYPVFRIERAKTIPCPAAHPRIDHLRDYPLSPLIVGCHPTHKFHSGNRQIKGVVFLKPLDNIHILFFFSPLDKKGSSTPTERMH